MKNRMIQSVLNNYLCLSFAQVLLNLNLPTENNTFSYEGAIERSWVNIHQQILRIHMKVSIGWNFIHIANMYKAITNTYLSGWVNK